MIPGFVLGALICSAALTLRWPRPSAVVLALSCAAWFPANKSMEGPVLVSVTPDHGLVAADLIGLAGLLYAAWVWRSASG